MNPMGAAEECLKKSYVKINYKPPQKLEIPKNCNDVLWTKHPEIFIGIPGHRDPINGIHVLCAAPFASGAGGIVMLLQITGYVEWTLSFINTQGRMVVETHRVIVSMPLMYKLMGPRMLLMAASPWKIKLIGYAGMIGKAFKSISEMQEILGKTMSRKVGFCPKDIENLQEGLKTLETGLNSLIRRAASSSADVELATRMKFSGPGTACFAGTHLA
jgi:hypothetical protein